MGNVDSCRAKEGNMVSFQTLLEINFRLYIFMIEY